MNQRNNFSGKPIISQILQFIPRDLVYRTAAAHKADRYTKTFYHLRPPYHPAIRDVERLSSLPELSTAMHACKGNSIIRH